MSAGWADAIASAPNVVSARIATKATVLLHRPAIMTLPYDLSHDGRTITPKYGEKLPATDQLEKHSPFQRLGR
jgi:hypothetical protein